MIDDDADDDDEMMMMKQDYKGGRDKCMLYCYSYIQSVVDSQPGVEYSRFPVMHIHQCSLSFSNDQSRWLPRRSRRALFCFFFLFFVYQKQKTSKKTSKGNCILWMYVPWIANPPKHAACQTRLDFVPGPVLHSLHHHHHYYALGFCKSDGDP